MQHASPIQLLPPELQNQIAAGEVVERPASVVKELVENAIDAGATRIRVEIRDGGQSLIRVTDNGFGIPGKQLELALTRHATSKLSSIQDLMTMRSFGFRGEALPSIASVSRFKLASATTDGEGSCLEVVHGSIADKQPVAMQKGTDISVQELFANVPARLKFLKQTATEARKCSELILRMALANLQVDLELIQSDRTVFDFKAGQTLAERLSAFWPGSILERSLILPDNPHIRGLVGSPDVAQARPDRILFFVNKRPVQDKILLSAVREAYRGRILGKEYPQAVLFLDLPPDEIDVNVHPAKTEIRFQDESHVFRLVRSAVLSALDHAHAPAISVSHQQSTPSAATIHALPVAFAPSERIEPAAKESTASFAPIQYEKFAATKTVEALFDAPQSHATTAASPKQAQIAGTGTYLGQIAKTYLVLNTADGLVLVDQHAAHERVLFNTFRTTGRRGDRQPLLIPVEISVHPSQTTLLQDLWNELHGLGFSLELTSPTRVLLKATPTLLNAAQAKEYLEEVLAGQARSMTDLWAIMACKAAIKAGDELAADEALALLEAWQLLPDRHYCPHGRPVQIGWSNKELEKLFKRRT